MSISGENPFDVNAVDKFLQSLQKPIETGISLYETITGKYRKIDSTAKQQTTTAVLPTQTTNTTKNYLPLVIVGLFAVVMVLAWKK